MIRRVDFVFALHVFVLDGESIAPVSLYLSLLPLHAIRKCSPCHAYAQSMSYVCAVARTVLQIRGKNSGEPSMADLALQAADDYHPHTAASGMSRDLLF